MDEQIELVLRALPELNQLTDEVLDLSRRVGASHLSYAADMEHSAPARAAYMTLCYVGKQDEHLRSLRMLVGAGQHRDAFLIARTMIEGLAQLLWAHGHQPEGPDEWLWYEVIEEWRQLQQNKRNGLPVDPSLEEESQRLLAKYGENYYTTKAKDRIAEGKQPPADPYRRTWTHLDAASIFNHVRGAALYETVYREASAWVHWSPRSMRLGFTEDEDVQKFVRDDPRRAAQALAAGVLSLLQTLEVVNNYFKVGIEDELATIYEAFDQALEPIDLVV